MEYKVCARCITDTSVAAARFDENGECNYCKIHDRLDLHYPLTEKGEGRYKKLIEKIKAKGKNKKYDCVLGLSGGRDSIYSLYLAKQLGLRPLAVHFNDGFGNPVTGENMKKATEKLNIDLRIITSDWRESKDIKIAFLKAATPDIEIGTDLGIASTLYGAATKENVQFVISGYSFRTEGIAPLEWNYLDGKYLKSVHKRFGTIELRKWKPDDPGFNLSTFNIFYYTVIKRIQAIPLLCYVNYKLKEAGEIIGNELDWVYPGAKYYDDLYQALMTNIYRVKFNIDRRRFNYSALIRSGQMAREEALEKVEKNSVIEDPDVISLCVKRLGISQKDLEKYLALPPRTFRDYPTSYNIIKYFRHPIKYFCKINLLPAVVYDKYFECI